MLSVCMDGKMDGYVLLDNLTGIQWREREREREIERERDRERDRERERQRERARERERDGKTIDLWISLEHECSVYYNLLQQFDISVLICE